MSGDEPPNLVLEHLRAICADLSALREDAREIELRHNDLARSLAALHDRKAPSGDGS